MTDWQDEAMTEAVEEATENDTPELAYANVDEFVREFLRHQYRRPINNQQRKWAAKWWESEEAVSRLDALWRAFEELRLDSTTGMSSFWRDHIDHHMPRLLDPDGPFSSLATEADRTINRGDPLPYSPPPAGMFADHKNPDSEKE